MNKSREFINIFNECLERLIIKGENIEQCLQSYPEYVDELKPLLEASQITRQASAIQPRPEFRDRARNQLYSVLRETEQKKSKSIFSWGWQPRWATAVVIVLVLFLAGGWTVTAANGSMPGSFLYPVKMATEQVQLAFTFTSLGKAELYAELADKRVAEIIYLAENNKTEKIEQVANNLNNDLAEITLLSSPQGVMTAMNASSQVEEKAVLKEGGMAQEAQESEEATGEQEAATAPPSEVAPEEAGEGEFFETAQLASDSGAGIVTDRRAELRVTIANQAINNTTSLRALLDIIPESARPALLRVIAYLEAGYENALKALE
jgi:predicted membrane protein